MLAWLLAYLLPMLLTFGIASTQKNPTTKLLIAHVSLLISIGLLLIGKWPLQVPLDPWFLTILVASVLVAFALLGLFGLAYFVSSEIQECCLLLAGITLIPAVGLPLAALLSGLVYALAHLLDPRGWQWKVPFLLAWGTASVFLYLWLDQPLLNIAIHAVAGSVLIFFGKLLPERKRYKR